MKLVRDEADAPYDGQTKAERNADDRFAMIPAPVFATGNGYAIAVYAALAKHADANGICRPSVATLCTITGWSRPTIHRALDVLIAAGLLIRGHRDYQGMKRSNEYVLPLHRSRPKSPEPQMSTSFTSMEATFTADVKDVDNRCKPRLQEVEPREQEPREQEGVPPLTPQRRVADLAGFEEWWTLFPRKENKAKAREIWKRLRPSPELVATIIAHTRAYAVCDKVQRGYILLPTTYLNGRRWEDELAPPTPVQPYATRPGQRLTSEQIMARARLFDQEERRS